MNKFKLCKKLGVRRPGERVTCETPKHVRGTREQEVDPSHSDWRKLEESCVYRWVNTE